MTCYLLIRKSIIIGKCSMVVPAGSRWSYLDGEARVYIGNITYSRAVVCQTKAYIKGQNERQTRDRSLALRLCL